jgi:hypothetical protein
MKIIQVQGLSDIFQVLRISKILRDEIESAERSLCKKFSEGLKRTGFGSAWSA